MTDSSTLPELLAEASSMIRSGKSRFAIPIYDRILEIDPESEFARRHRGFAKTFLGDHAGAIAEFTEVIRRWPTKPESFMGRAGARKSAGDLQGAISDYSVEIELDPRHASAYFHRGRTQVEAGDLTRAIADFTQAIALDSMGPVSGLLNRGKARHAMGDLSGAIADLSEAMKWEHDDPVYSSLYRGRVRFDAGDYAGAIADFTRAINAFPGLTNAYRHRAEARSRMQDDAGANEDLAIYANLGGRDLPAYQ